MASLRGQVHVSRRSVGTELKESTGDSPDVGGYSQHPANCASIQHRGFNGHVAEELELTE